MPSSSPTTTASTVERCEFDGPPIPPGLKPLDRIHFEAENAPRLDRDADRYVRSVLSTMPETVLTTSPGEIVRLRPLQDRLTDEESRLKWLARTSGEDAAANLQASLKRAQDRLRDYLAPLYGNEQPDVDVKLEHVHDDELTACPEHASETSEATVETPLGRCVIRVRRCITCGAQAVVNRRITIRSAASEGDRS